MENQTATPTVPGTPFAGGFYAGRIRIDGQVFALAVAPKADGEFEEKWNSNTKAIEDAASYFDGRANTLAMAAAGSELAKNALRLQVGGHNDWYIPSRDEMEICYRNLKPTAEANYCYRGDNPSSVPPGYIYTEACPAQTQAEAFMEGGAEAFDDAWYWTSTQGAADSDYAWVQHFSYGVQGGYHKSDEYRARAVRRLLIIE
jgi:Protein of unknown function (DUF1566)